MQHTSVRVGQQLRADIQGLRAICILAVVLCHAKVPGFAGGFVGVDIFFAVSGFLIVGLLIDEQRTSGTVDLVRFWSKRARRLLPNATLTLIATLLIGSVLVPNHEWDRLTREVAAAALYTANYVFASRAVDYFQFDDELSPVLHFWSLNIEEQFYFVWPLLFLVACSRPAVRRFAVPGLLALIFVASFVYGLIAVRSNQPLAYFHTETRCWQLAAGGLAAVYYRAFTRLPAVAGWIGLLGIAASVGTFNDAMSYPGLWALLPTLSAIAVLLSSCQSGANRLISHRILRWFGDRSYSWYLWHWPILIFATMLFPGWQLAVLLSVPLSLAIAHYVFQRIEDPIRRGAVWQLTPARSLVAGALSIAFILTCGAFVARLPDAVAEDADSALRNALKAAKSDHGTIYADGCHIGYAAAEAKPCIYGDRTGHRRAALFGDSHAAQWFAALDRASRGAGWQLHSLTKTTCPAADVTVWYQPKRAAYHECDQWRRETLDLLTETHKPDVVFISSHSDYRGWMQDRLTGEVLRGEKANEAYRQGLRATLMRLSRAGIPVVLIRDTPRATKTFATCLARGGGSLCGRPRPYAVEHTVLDVMVGKSLSHHGVEVLDLTGRICEDSICPVTKDGMIVYLDHHHLTATFSQSLSGDFADLLSRRQH